MTSKFSNEPARLAAAGLSLALPFFALACGHEAPPAIERTAVRAATQVIEPAEIASTRVLTGTVVSENVSPLSAKVVGNVVRVLVSEGDRVRKGQLLVEIDAREGQAQTDRARAGAAEVERAIEAAQAHATLAGATLRRYSVLFERRSVSEQEFDTVKAANAAAEAELARALARRDEARALGAQASTFLDYSYVRSPIDGVVTRRFVDPGTQAAPGMPLVRVEDDRRFRVEATVPDSLHVRAGDRVVLETVGSRSEAAVQNVQPGLETASRSALIKIELPAALLPARSGAFVRVHVATGKRSALTLPEGAIVHRGHLTTVFVVGGDGVARMRVVTLGADGEILSGLDAGERIVTEPSKVTDGAKIV